MTKSSLPGRSWSPLRRTGIRLVSGEKARSQSSAPSTSAIRSPFAVQRP